MRRCRGVVVAALAVVCSAPPAFGQGPAPRVLVMPFDNVTREGRILWVGEASSVLLADELNLLGVSAITRRERIAAFEWLQVPPSAGLSEATMFRIGQVVGASHVVVGTVRLDADELVVHARSIALEEGRVYREATERGPLTDLYAMFSRVAQQLAPPAAPRPPGTSGDRLPITAFENYIKGLLAETPSTAISYLNAALQASATFYRVRLALWDVYAEQGDHERALAAVQQVPASEPLGRRARFLAGLSQLTIGRYTEAYATFRALADIDPSANVLNNLGVVQLRRDDAPEAGLPADFFTRAADSDPGEPDYRFNAGYAYWRAGDPTAAIHWLREAVRRNPADSDAHFVLAASLAAEGNAVEAQRELVLAQRLSSRYADHATVPARGDVPVGLERVKGDVELLQARRFDLAVAADDQRNQDDVARFHIERGRRLFEQERDREAIAELNRAVFLSPYSAEAHLLIGRVHLRAGRPGEAATAFRISIWSEDSADAHAALAQALLELGDRAEARTEASRALALDPGSTDARDVLDETERPSR